MKRLILRTVALLTLAATLGTAVPVSADEYDNVITLDIDGFDCKTSEGNLIVYKNDSDDIRVVGANEYGFRYTKVMVFNADGRLIEAGGDMFENSDTVTGSPQESVNIPPHGFLIGFNPYNVKELQTAFTTAMEGAMLYNATMSVIYEMYGSIDGNKLTIKYDNPSPDATDAKKFMFIGNSSTYFNGTPIKFKGLAKAAGIDVVVDYCTFGSAFLYEFADANHERGIKMRNMLKSCKYDYVVLQDGGSADYYDSKPAVDTIMPFIKENGAEALLYMRYSSNSDPAQRVQSAKRHYDNYTQLAEDYGLVCSPAADAFLICTEKYPEINLYADDNSHHSKEGSYLIACCMLRSYLGKDPLGNSYTADMDEETARKLQECANLAIDEGYKYPSTEDVFVANDGNTYENVAVGKPYTPTGNAYTGDWTDTGADGKPMGKLTDGKYANAGDDHAIGCYTGSGHSIIIDLGTITNLRAVKTDLWGNEGWGIANPANACVSIEFSNDGTNYFDPSDATMSEESADGSWIKRDFLLELESPINARYIKVTYTGPNFIWSSEISAYGKVFENDDPQAPSQNEQSGEDTGDYEEPKNKKLAWLYWTLGAAAVIGVGAAAYLIFFKKKKK
ncbi:MAG: hypothetical protein E7595_05720 [Ruminococcaceae bacterium]|nr:hypothetical protein [Oscillospiraceae bacterium]